MEEDTIVAVSTPRGYGGIGIVRFSGKRSLSIARKLFKPRRRTKKIPPRKPILGDISPFQRNGDFEEGFLVYFPPPHTYTREEVVEISCHGSPLVLDELVRQGIKAGARHADPGEFTLRAYLNGRIDIIQAEAINDLIRAKTLTQAQISFQQLKGSLSGQIHSLREKLVHLISQIEACIEFPEEELGITPKQISGIMDQALTQVQNLVESYKLGRTYSEGLTLAIAGRTNVGKSTLFNSLLQEPRAIVTPHPGTTRDYLEEKIQIHDSVFSLVDMAGIEKSGHPVEKEGIQRGKKKASQADGILLLLDASASETEEDIRLINKYKQKKTLLVFNKIDLSPQMDKKKVKKSASHLSCLEVSALKGTHLEKLKDKIYQSFVPSQQKQQEVILHFRQKLLLDQILEHLKEGKRLLKQGYPEDLYVEEIRESISLMGHLTGKVKAREIINHIFSQFCIGK
ncbi:tRNA uridine-5-carboxymethylaminomethyl(34) synthesis GTPase MnmE [bacterium]|nr:tRNA uridine-5-carboxymethylaminomethyl(34) synthesis GTPase MnmE [bacterium]